MVGLALGPNHKVLPATEGLFAWLANTSSLKQCGKYWYNFWFFTSTWRNMLWISAFIHIRKFSKNTELFLLRDTCSCFYFIQAEFLQSTSIWVTTSGSRKAKVCTKLGCSPGVQNSKLRTYNNGTSSTAVATSQATNSNDMWPFIREKISRGLHKTRKEPFIPLRLT